MHFFKAQFASGAVWLGFFLKEKQDEEKSWAKQAGYSTYQSLILTSSFLDVQVELIRLFPCL